jgi:tetratricopeptide (TPR) repeat protein
MARLRSAILSAGVTSILLLLSACSGDPHSRAVRYVENGNKFFEREKFKEASIMYRRAIAPNADPRFGEAYYRLGLTSMKLSDLGGAYRNFIRAVELQPTNSDALAKTADIEVLVASQGGAQAEGLLDGAKERATKLLAMKDGAYDGNRLMGQISLLRKENAEAVKFFEAAEKIKPGDEALQLAYFSALVQNGQFPQAEQLARALIDRKKDYAPIYDLLYVQYIQRQQPAEAEALLKQKVANNPSAADYVLQLAAHYTSTKQPALQDQTLARLEDSKAYPNGRLLAGDFFLRLRDYNRAQGQYEAGVKSAPAADKPTYQKRLIAIFADTNRIADANKLLAELLKEHADDEEALSMRAALRLFSGTRDEINLAVNEFQGLVTKTPNNHQLHFNYSRALLAKGEIEQARVQLEESIKVKPDFLAGHELLARIYLGRNDGAKALQEADVMLRLDKNNLAGHLVRASAMMLLGKPDAAQLEVDFVTKTFPQNTDARYMDAYLSYEAKNFGKAAQIFGDLHRANPREFRGLVGVVETMASQGNVPGALRELEAALAAEPERQEVRVALGNMMVRSQRYDDAIRLYGEVLTKNPKSGDVLYRLAESYRRKGDLNNAIDYFRRASQQAPNDPGPLLQLGLLMDGTGRRDQSKPIYEQILRVQPEHAVALNNLAMIKADEGNDLDTALGYAQRAYQQLPDAPDVADTLGWVYIKKNLSQEALRTFTDLVKKYPSKPGYRMHYGMALLQSGDKPAAKRELEAALNSGPSKDELNQIQQLLKQF